MFSESVKAGQIWRGEDNQLWRVVAVGASHAWVRSAQSKTQSPMQVLLAWFDPQYDGSWERTS